MSSVMAASSMLVSAGGFETRLSFGARISCRTLSSSANWLSVGRNVLRACLARASTL